MYTQGSVDAVGIQFGSAMYDGHVFLLHGTIFKLAGDFPLSLIVFGHDHNASGVAVQSVYDTGSELPQSTG